MKVPTILLCLFVSVFLKYCHPTQYNLLIVVLQYVSFHISRSIAKTNQKLVLDNVGDIKDFKKLLRTKTNVLVCFYNSQKDAQNVIKLFKEVADSIKGEGTLAVVDCSQ